MRTHQPRRFWTNEEDQRMCDLVLQHGPKRWKRIAEHLPGRSDLHCRDRWTNHLNPGISEWKRVFSRQEDQQLIDMVAEFGSRWALIARSFHKRSDIQLKNRYSTLVRQGAAAAAAAPIPLSASTPQSQSQTASGASDNSPAKQTTVTVMVTSTSSGDAASESRDCPSPLLSPVAAAHTATCASAPDSDSEPLRLCSLTTSHDSHAAVQMSNKNLKKPSHVISSSRSLADLLWPHYDAHEKRQKAKMSLRELIMQSHCHQPMNHHHHHHQQKQQQHPEPHTSRDTCTQMDARNTDAVFADDSRANSTDPPQECSEPPQSQTSPPNVCSVQATRNVESRTANPDSDALTLSRILPFDSLQHDPLLQRFLVPKAIWRP